MRGCQKRVVFLKNTGSSIFEGAYFILKEDNICQSGGKTECDMVNEASRIIEENISKNKRSIRRYLPHAIAFLLGALLCAVSFLLI